VFIPNRLDKLFGGKGFDHPLSAISDFEVMEGGLNAARNRGSSALIRKQIKVAFGSEEAVITTSEPKSLISELSKLRGTRGA
jgi:hypothetical protein